MARASEGEKDTLRAAAGAATTMIAKLEQDKAKIDSRIQKLRTVVDAYDSVSGRRRKPAASSERPISEQQGIPKRGMAAKHVNAVLFHGGDFIEPEIRKMIKDQFGFVYNRPAIYNVLRRGLQDGRYIKNGYRWSMSPSGKMKEVFEDDLVGVPTITGG